MIYLDNAATTYPKPLGVKNNVMNSFSYGANPGRAGHKLSLRASEEVYNCREALKSFFNADEAENVIFTPSCTHSLNTVIKGVLSKGDHVVISSLEHNSVLRPLERLSTEGVISYSVAEVYEADFDRTFESFRNSLKKNTKLVICTHASNVFGIKLPIERIAALCKYYGILFCVDGAQTAGVCNIDVRSVGIDYLCVPGHKGLYGPMGIGALIINSKNIPKSLCEGGTGSGSSILSQPEILPDKFESGTLNLSGIAGLSAGLRFVTTKGIDNLRLRELMLMEKLYDSLDKINGIKLYTQRPSDKYHVPLFSVNLEGISSDELANILDNKYSIATRGGIHCSPLAHRSYKTDDIGTVRISPSAFTTLSEINSLVMALRQLSQSIKK
ncbi:MAG: aminotransferase class V-fold PLP-dependent enzyme [Ruminococcus sp.]